MKIAIISIIVGVIIGVVCTVMYYKNNDSDIKKHHKVMVEKVDSLRNENSIGFENVNKRLDGIDKKLDILVNMAMSCRNMDVQ